MPPVFFPLYYQLLEAYRPVSFTPSTPSISIVESIPTPTPKVISIKTLVPSYIASNNDGDIDMVFLGDSMIDTLSYNICQASFRRYFPGKQFNILKYGYGSTNIESAFKRLTETTSYLGKENPSILSQNPKIIVIESFAYNNFGNSQNGIDRQTKALQNIIDTIKNKLPDTKIVLAATISPNSVVFGNGIKDMHFSAFEKIEKTNTIKVYLQNIVNFAGKNSYALADAFHPSLFGSNGLESLINSADHLHPSSLGTELFCDTVAKTVLDHKFIN